MSQSKRPHSLRYQCCEIADVSYGVRDIIDLNSSRQKITGKNIEEGILVRMYVVTETFYP
jgi:hypothetical protein